MSFKIFVLCATLAIARAGYLQPAARYAHAAPFAIAPPAPAVIAAPAPLTYTVPPTIKAEPLSPVVTTSYGYTSAHTPVPAPIVRAHPVHHAPLAHFSAPAPLVPAFAGNLGGHATSFGFGPHVAPLAFGHGYAGAFGFGGHPVPAPAAFGHGYATGFGFGAPAHFGIGHGPIGFGGHFNPGSYAFTKYGGHF